MHMQPEELRILTVNKVVNRIFCCCIFNYTQNTKAIKILLISSTVETMNVCFLKNYITYKVCALLIYFNSQTSELKFHKFEMCQWTLYLK